MTDKTTHQDTGGDEEGYGVITESDLVQQYPSRFLRGADILLFSIVPVGVFSLLPMWSGPPPIHGMFTTALVINVLSFQFGLLPSIYPASWYAEEDASTNPTHTTVSPPVKGDERSESTTDDST